jgi:hypothetical protein
MDGSTSTIELGLVVSVDSSRFVEPTVAWSS